jgi:pimeloyl-ACP methyl ester carboxylesterase
MRRTRNEQRWATPFHHYPSLEDFLTSPVDPGGITFQHQGHDIDVLYEHRGSDATLVVFNAAIAFTHEHTPIFTGQTLARQAGTNLIAVSDPLLCHQQISAAWYLGDQHTGPLRPVLAPAIQHILNATGSTRTILFGASGGGYAAEHYAHQFPGSIALLMNPRLSLARANTFHMPRYMEHGHGITSNGVLTDEHHQLLERYGPVHLATAATDGLNHDLLIYQNLLDARFIQDQFLPFAEATGQDPRFHVRLANDGPDHVRIPFPTLRNIITTLQKTPHQPTAISTAGFTPYAHAGPQALQHMPKIGTEVIQLKNSTATLEQRVEELEATNQQLITEAHQYQQQLNRLQQEPKFAHRLWRVIPHRWRQRIKHLLKRG